MSVRFEVTRRQFITSTGALLVAVSAVGLPRLLDRASSLSLPGSLRRNPSLDTWLRIDAAGTVTVFSGKVELGQGIRTALAQIVSDELDVEIRRIRMETVDTSHSPDEGRTVGSNSVPDSGTALRHAAAQARQILLDNASVRLGIPAARLSVEDGVVSAPDDRKVSYWEVLGDQSFDAEIHDGAPVKPPSAHRYVGAPQPRLDLPAKLFAAPAFIQDMRMPGMVHARVVRGDAAVSEIVSLDETGVRRMPGVVEVVRDGNFLAVVAEREEQAIAAATALKRATLWGPAAAHPSLEDLPALLQRLATEDQVIVSVSHGDTSVAREISADYSRPFISHASLGPSCAIAHWDGTTMTVWSHAQGMYPLRGTVADILGVPQERVRCVHAEGAGCYGHNGADDAACDAALIARAVPDRPIRLQWMREDEFSYAPYGSAMSLRASAGLDAADRIVTWRYDLYSCSHSTRPSGGRAAGHALAAREKADPLPLPPVSDGRQPTGGADRNSIPLYRFESQRITEHIVQEPPLRSSALRSLGAHANVFAIESFIDEIAREVGADPFEYRLRHLDDPRGREVLLRVRELAAAAPAVEASGRVGRGIAFSRYKNLSTYLALVVDVSVDPETGGVRVLRALAATDVGQIINPDGVRNQIEGGIVQATSWTLKERVRASGRKIESTDWASYPILRFSEVPDIEVVLIDRPELPSVGAGEAAQGPTSAAIANAIADATGARLRDLPLTAARVMAALRG